MERTILLKHLKKFSWI